MSDIIKSEAAVDQSDRPDEVSHFKPEQTLDTVHNDEALKVLENYSGDPTWTDAEEARLRRKVDWRLMPILCMTYGLVYYDKAMLSQAVSPRQSPPVLVRLYYEPLTILTYTILTYLSNCTKRHSSAS